MTTDLLENIRKVVDQAVGEGIAFKDFRAKLEPILKARGWCGRRPMEDPLTGKTREVQLGSVRRLGIIYDTTLRTSFSEGRWAQVQRIKRAMMQVATPAEWRAGWDYSAHSDDINAPWRRGEVTAQAHALYRLMQKLPVYGDTVWRGVRMPIDAALAKYVPGATVEATPSGAPAAYSTGLDVSRRRKA
ncbi:MAG: hypothetical protein ACREQX_08090 [Candidatus Binataceae bacterium]